VSLFLPTLPEESIGGIVRFMVRGDLLPVSHDTRQKTASMDDRQHQHHLPLPHVSAHIR
jgi:hypothetical protein